MKIKKFAFIVHPVNRKDFLNFYPFFKYLPFLVKRYNFKDIARKFSSKKFIEIKIKLPQDKSLSSTNMAQDLLWGIGIGVPLFPEDFVRLEESIVLDKIKQACLLAEKKGAGIIGLGGFTSIVGDEGRVLADQINAAITSGNTYTAYLALEGIFKAVKLLEKDLSSCTACVVGATGDIGSICSKVLAKKVKRIILVARNLPRLEEFSQKIKALNSASVEFTKYTQEAVKESEIILTATSSLTTLIEPQQLKSGSIVCDVAIPPNIAREIYKIRQDVLVFEGGKAKIPFSDKIKNRLWQSFFPEGIIFGCLAETILLALEGYFSDFSIGRGKITEDKLNFIAALSQKYGFSLAPFKCGDKILDEKAIKLIKENIKR